MAFWNEHAFEAHADELLNGSFVSPVTGELFVLSWSERAIAQNILRRYWASKEEPWGTITGHYISRRIASSFVGKQISEPLWRVAMLNLELAGIFSLIRERGEAHKITLGKLLRCDLNECQESQHYPDKYPLPNVSTPLPEVRRELSLGEETPNVSSYINKLNNFSIISNSDLEVSESFGYSHSPASKPVEPKLDQASGYQEAQLEELPEYWREWLQLSAERKGFTEPTGGDIAHALVTYEKTGLDLEADGSWRYGRALPRPKEPEKQAITS